MEVKPVESYTSPALHSTGSCLALPAAGFRAHLPAGTEWHHFDFDWHYLRQKICRRSSEESRGGRVSSLLTALSCAPAATKVRIERRISSASPSSPPPESPLSSFRRFRGFCLSQ